MSEGDFVLHPINHAMATIFKLLNCTLHFFFQLASNVFPMHPISFSTIASLLDISMKQGFFTIMVCFALISL